MTKLEEKLLELGYKYIEHNDYFKKKFNDDINLIVCIIDDEVNEGDCGIEYNEELTIDLLTRTSGMRNRAFNEMEKDLEELKKYEKTNAK